MKAERMFKVLLSGVALIGVFAVPAFGLTSVYSISPDSAKNSGWANSMSQSFVCTADSLDSVAVFVGTERVGKIYTAKLKEGPYGPTIWSGSKSATGWAYEEIGFGVHKPVVRGKTYYLELSIMDSTFLPLQWNYYYRNGDKYPWGEMELGGGKDLCATVAGVNRTDSTYWGVAGESVNQDELAAKAKQIGINLDREQVEWRNLQPDSNRYEWAWLDAVVDSANRKGLRVMINFYATPLWASNIPLDAMHDTADAWRYPPRNLDRSFGQGDSNFLWKFVHTLATRYKDKVQDYETWNETNYYDWWRYGIRPGPPDTNDNRYYNTGEYQLNTSGRAKLYVRACQVAYDAIKGVYRPDTATAHTNAVLHMNVPTQSQKDATGREWMQYYYQHGGKSYADVIGWHWYQGYQEAYHRFLPGRFIADYDTLRRIMWDAGDGAKPVWANEGGFGSPDTVRPESIWSVGKHKQADIVLQASVVGLGQRENGIGPALNQVNWYKLYDRDIEYPGAPLAWFKWCGLLNKVDSGFTYKPSAYAYKQMTGKLKDKYFNRRVPLADTNVYCYEFQTTDTGLAARKTWVVWKTNQGAVFESLSVRTPYFNRINITYTGAETLVSNPALPNGFGQISVDTMPVYYRETLDVARPDVIVDSLYTYPTTPRAGDYVFFYARLKNIGNATLSANLGNAVKFQVDGVTKKTYTDNREIMKDSTIIVGYNPYPPPGDGSIYDWKATWGDHLIRAWVDSSDKYVELREDNNTGYIFKHNRPKVTLIINGNHKYSNHLTNDTLSISMNGNTTPLPDSAKLLHEGSWTSLGVYGSRDTLVTFNGNGVKYDSVIVYQGADTALAGDSIIVDADAPFVDITSPTQNQTVSGSVPFVGWSWDYQDHDSLWEIYVNGSPWVSGNAKVGENPMFGMPDTFGFWNSTTVPNGYRWHQLRSTDFATNLGLDSVRVYVLNSSSEEDGFASGFGSFGSSPMNVATDKKGNVYVPETQGSMVRKFSSRKDTLFSFSARRGNDTTGSAWPAAIVCDPETLSGMATFYVADGYANCVKRFDVQGNLLLRFGSIGSDTGEFRRPTGIALDHKGRLFVVDGGNHRVQVFDTTGKFLFQFGGLGRDSGKMNSPAGIAITPNKLVWISDSRNNQIQVFDSTGKWIKTIKKPDSLGFDTPTGICSDKHGNLFIADTKHHRIVELNPYGRRLFTFGSEGDSLCQFKNPIGVTSSPGAHYLYVADMGNKRVTRFWVIRGDTLGGGGPQAGAVVQLLPLVYELGPAIPNPSKGQTTFRYALPKESRVNMTFYNVAGQVVKEFNQGKQKAGYYSLKWDGRNNQGHKVGPGVYFYRLQAGSWAKTRKMVVIR